MMYLVGVLTLVFLKSDYKFQYDVCKQVASERYSRVCNAKLAGISSWRMIVDLGLFFQRI